MKPKLMLKQIENCSMESSCAWLKTKNERRMMLKLRGGTAAFEIETGRWHGVSIRREDRVCKECGSGEVEDVHESLVAEVCSMGGATTASKSVI